MPLNFYLQRMFQYEFRASHHENYGRTLIVNALLIQQLVLSFGNALENELYSILLSLKNIHGTHAFHVSFLRSLRYYIQFAIEYTCITERKHI